VHGVRVDIFDAVVRAVGLGPDAASGWGSFADDFACGVTNDVFGGLVNDDDAGEVVVMERDLSTGWVDDFHDADALIFEDRGVAFWRCLRRRLRTGRGEQAQGACEEKERFH